MGYRKAKRKVLDALARRQFSDEVCGDISVKKLLQIGEVTPEQVISMIKSSGGNDHASSPHHSIAGIEVHVIRCRQWYIKFYFVDPDTVFISVHQ